MATCGPNDIRGIYMFNASTAKEVGYYIKTHIEELWTPFFKLMKDAAKESLNEENDSELESENEEPGWSGGKVFTLFKKIMQKHPNKTDKFYIKQLTKGLANKGDSSIISQMYLYEEEGNKEDLTIEIVILNYTEGKYIQI